MIKIELRQGNAVRKSRHYTDSRKVYRCNIAHLGRNDNMVDVIHKKRSDLVYDGAVNIVQSLEPMQKGNLLRTLLKLMCEDGTVSMNGHECEALLVHDVDGRYRFHILETEKKVKR